MNQRVLWASLACAAVVALPSCGGDDSASYVPLKVGQCLPARAKVIGQREADPPVVSCSKPHRFEVYAIDRVTIDVWPGQEAVDDAAAALCDEDFVDGTGIQPEDIPDGLKKVTIGPSQLGWTKRKDTRVECLLAFTKDRTGRLVRP